MNPDGEQTVLDQREVLASGNGGRDFSGHTLPMCE
jgi:hypothetical protein